jgi:hypothetical protein
MVNAMATQMVHSTVLTMELTKAYMMAHSMAGQKVLSTESLMAPMNVYINNRSMAYLTGSLMEYQKESWTVRLMEH